MEDDFVFEFRDGRRSVPPHIAPLFEEFDTKLVTYEQAIEFVNLSMMNNHLTKVQDDTIRQHFIRYPKT